MLNIEPQMAPLGWTATSGEIIPESVLGFIDNHHVQQVVINSSKDAAQYVGCVVHNQRFLAVQTPSLIPPDETAAADVALDLMAAPAGMSGAEITNI